MAKSGSKNVSISASLTRPWYTSANRAPLGEPPSQIWYELGPSPTNPTSALYGLAQPFGQPVILMMNFSLECSPRFSRTALSLLITSGRPRSASAMARPHSGSAGQAMEPASSGSHCSTSLMPAAERDEMMSSFHAGEMFLRIRFWFAVMLTGISYLSMTARSVFFASPLTRPFCT